jgi:hypothetical protein
VAGCLPADRCLGRINGTSQLYCFIERLVVLGNRTINTLPVVPL